jgi:hypothetical protein
MIIYCDGDSFVAGTELGDTILPEHPGFLPFLASSELRERNERWINRTFGEGDLASIRRSRKKEIALLEKERAFSNKIATKLNVTVVNTAASGSSIDAICRRTLTNLIRLKDQDNITAIIGITDPWRFELPSWYRSNEVDNFVTDNGENLQWIDIHPQTAQDTYDHIGSIIKYRILVEKNYHSLVRFYKNIISIQDFCKVNNIKLFFVSPRNIIPEIEKDFSNIEDYVNLKKYSNLNIALSMQQLAIECDKKENVMCPNYHYNEVVHEIVANKIIELI